MHQTQAPGRPNSATARPGRAGGTALQRSGIDTLMAGVVLATAAGFRFLAERHFQHADGFGAPELLVAMEVVLIPLALAAMVVAARGQRWRELGVAPGIGGTWGGLAVLAAAAGLLLLRASAPTPLDSPAMALAGALLVVTDELLRRAFLLNELTDLFGRGRVATGGALGTLGLTEALAHAPAGASAAISAGGSDLMLGAAYLAAGRSLLGPVLARGLAYICGRCTSLQF